MDGERQSSDALLAAGQEALAAAYFRTADFGAVTRIPEQAPSQARAAGDRGAEAAVIDQQGLLMHFMTIEHPPEVRATIDFGPEQELFERALELARTEGPRERHIVAAEDSPRAAEQMPDAGRPG